MTIKFDISATSTAPLIRQFPYMFKYAASVAINDVAFQARKDLGAHAKRVFKNPRKLTQNAGEVIIKSTPETLKARIGLRDQVAKGTAPATYLYPQVYGGPRKHKRIEKVLIRANLMNPDNYMIPVAQNLRDLNDGNGNFKGSKATMMLSHLQAFGEQGYKANIKQSRRSMFFSIKDKGQMGILSPGIYRWTDKANDRFEIVAVFIKSRPTYKRRFYYLKTVEKTARKTFGPSFSRRFQNMAKKKVQEFNLINNTSKTTRLARLP